MHGGSATIRSVLGSQALGVVLLGTVGLSEPVGSCDPDVIKDRAMKLAPSLGSMRASERGGIVSLEVEGRRVRSAY